MSEKTMVLVEGAQGEDIPIDGRMFRMRRHAHGEDLVGPWHATEVWLRQHGLFNGMITRCGRVYVPEEGIELRGAEADYRIKPPRSLGFLCRECFPEEARIEAAREAGLLLSLLKDILQWAQADRSGSEPHEVYHDLTVQIPEMILNTVPDLVPAPDDKDGSGLPF